MHQLCVFHHFVKKFIQITIYDFTSVCLSVCGYVSHTLGISVTSQNVTNKSFLVCVKSEKYTFWFTLSHLGSMRQGKAELNTLHYQARQSQAAYIRTHFSVSSPAQCQSQAAMCVSTPRMYQEAPKSLKHTIFFCNFY